jgi:hypothetical protein
LAGAVGFSQKKRTAAGGLGSIAHAVSCDFAAKLHSFQIDGTAIRTYLDRYQEIFASIDSPKRGIFRNLAAHKAQERFIFYWERKHFFPLPMQ